MSKTVKIIIFVVFIHNFCLLFAQNDERKLITIYIDNLEDKALEGYSISKDTTSAHFSIYLEKYESKKARKLEINEYKSKIKKITFSKVDPDSVFLSDFSITFYTFNEKPERLKSIISLKYLTVDMFQKNNYISTNPTYIIHKLKDGTYLKWSAITLN